MRLNSNDCPKRGQIITVTLHHLYLHTYVAILMANSQNDAQSLNCLKPLTQGINELANFHFLQRLSVIFGFHRDCLRSLASCRDYCPRKLGSCRDCLCDSASCRDSTVLAGSKRSRTASAEAKYHGQSLQEAKISKLVYTLCLSAKEQKFTSAKLKKIFNPTTLSI